MAAAADKIDFSYTLDDKYTRESGRVYLSGIQALVRLPMMQHMRDQAAGLNTGGFISGYRGSPLGGLDLNLWRARKHLADYNIEFVAGLNEDLAATAVWGSQQTNLFPGATVDGVFSMWYGKGPGVDRSGDVLKHGNAAGSSPNGGVLVLAGDDHACRSSTLPHQSEHEFISAMMPILNPASVQDILDMGLLGWALSRFTGRWVGFKTIAENVESSASALVDPHQLDIVIPDDFEMPRGGLNIRWPDPPMAQEMRLHQYSLRAARAFARANEIDRIVIDSPKARLGIATTGKAYLDVLQALEDLGISREMAADIGIRVYKIGMTWPLERHGITRFAKGLEDIIVVEEKRSFIESQIKEQAYNWPADIRPSIIGKYNEKGDWILPSTGELTPAVVARVIASRLQRFFNSEAIDERLRFLEHKEQLMAKPRVEFHRTPHFCSGCPHNTSTQVPEGSRAMAGIGCHYMTVWMDRNTETFTQMGGEGVPWIGQAAFTETDHVFANLGDGTYFHSGVLAIRACIAAKVNITFKILYNDAVAMTGGQPVDGSLTVPDIARQVRAEGAKTVIVVADDPDRWTGHREQFHPDVRFEHRDDLDTVQRDMREEKGVSVLIYDQTCAAEKRRRRKRGLMEDPVKRVFINERVCEGCGDCGVQSNCLSILPSETELGRKRRIDQSSCNKDFSCVKGFCPSFVTVHGGQLKKRKSTLAEPQFEELPQPVLPEIDGAYDILVTGVGGTGVITIGALLGMAAHLENKGVTVLDQTGLAQKGGAVTSHVRIANQPDDIHAVRIAAGSANLILGCDNVVAGDYDALAKMAHGLTYAVVNTNEAMPGSFANNANLEFPAAQITAAISDAVDEDRIDLIDATRLATALLGDSIASNLFMLGFAWQQGRLPVSLEALTRAIELNGVAVAANQRAFQWGRMAAVDLPMVEAAAKPPIELAPVKLARTLDETISYRRHYLTQYQDAAYADRYESLVRKVEQAESRYAAGKTGLAAAVARYYFKLLAIKDEYEVARLYADGEFTRQLEQNFEGNYRLKFNLAPPLFARRDPQTGHLRKSEYGAWVMPAFKLLAALKGLRGTWLDVFAYTDERKCERQILANYERTINELIQDLDYENHALALEIASLPEQIRGYGHVRERHLEAADKHGTELLARFRFKGEKQGAA
jgi:indolepyruvate ferredoxin oxidoreductase